MEHSQPPDDARLSDRRRWLRWAAAGGAAAVAATALDGPEADAANGTAVAAGSVNNWGNAQTTVVHNNLGGANQGPALSGHRTSGSTTGISFSENVGVLGDTDVAGQAGVLGFGGTGGPGIEGWSYAQYGAFGHSTNGCGVYGQVEPGGTGVGGGFAGGRAQLLLVPAATAGAPTTQTHSTGELFLDSTGTLYLCTAAGTPGTWVDLSTRTPSPSGPTLHFVTPTRVYDSRQAAPAPGPLASGGARTIGVADGRSLSGEVSVPDLVPAGATGVSYNLTITRTAGSGYLTVNPGTSTEVTSSAINWYADGQTVASASSVGIDAARQITVIAGGGGSTDFLVDVVGYHL